MGKNISFGERQTYQPKDRKDFIKHFDSLIVVQPGPLALRKKFIEITGWKEGDGPCELVFKSRPAGHRCFWSCQWSVKGGMLDINSYMPLGQMCVQALLSEAADRVIYDPQSAAMVGLSSALLQWLTQDGSAADHSLIENIIEGLRKRRPGPEYSGWWDLPQRFLGMNLDRGRPGWPAPVRENVSPYVG